MSIGLSFAIISLRYAVSFGNYIDPIHHLFLFGPTLASLILILIVKGDSIRMVSLNKFQNIKSLVIAIIAMLLAIIISRIIQHCFGFISIQRSDQFFFLFDRQFSPLIGSVLWIIFLFIHAGFAEEFAWRGYLFSKLKSLSWIEFVFVLNTIWAVWHFPFMPFDKIYQYILFWFLCVEFGTILIYVRLKTGSVLASMILHPIVVISLAVIFVPYFRVINEDGAGWPNYIIALLLLPISIYYFIKGQDIYESTQENPRFVC
jgi:membrane protease YdiL (CAAX protease family)